MPAVCSSLYLERKHRLEYIEGGASRKGRQTNRWTVVPGDGGGEGRATTSDRLPRVKTRARGKRKNENRRTDGRTLDKQGAIEINREYCEEYAQTRNTHSSSPSTFSTPYPFFPSSIPPVPLSLSLSFSLLPIPSMSPFSLSFVRTRACSLFLTFVARLASAFTTALLFFFTFTLTRPELNLCPEMFR